MDNNLIRVDLSGVVHLLPDVPGARVTSSLFDLGHQVAVRYEREGHAVAGPMVKFKNWSASAIHSAVAESYKGAVAKWHEEHTLILQGIEESDRMTAELVNEQIRQAVRISGDAA